MVSINQLDLLERILHRDVGLVSHEPACFDGVLHASDHAFSLLVNQCVTIFWDGGEVDTLSFQRRSISQTIAHVQVDVLGEEWRHWRDELCGAQQHIEEDVKGKLLVFSFGVVSLHARPVESNVPIG